MNEIQDYLNGLVGADKLAGADFDALSIAELEAYLGITDSDDVEKLASMCSPSCDGDSFLTQFEGTPLMEQALALAEAELGLEEQSQKQRVADQKMWGARDALRLQKDKLLLELHRVKAVAAAAPPPPPAVEPLAPKIAGEVTYQGFVNNGEKAPPQMPASMLGTEAAGRRATAEDLNTQDDTATPQHVEPKTAGGRLLDAVKFAAKAEDVETRRVEKMYERAAEKEREGLSDVAGRAVRRGLVGGGLGYAAGHLAGGNLPKAVGTALGGAIGIHSGIRRAEAHRRLEAKEKKSALSDEKQEHGLAKAVAGLQKSKMDPDRKAALAKGLGKAMKKEVAEKDPAPALGKTSAEVTPNPKGHEKTALGLGTAAAPMGEARTKLVQAALAGMKKKAPQAITAEARRAAEAASLRGAPSWGQRMFQ